MGVNGSNMVKPFKLDHLKKISGHEVELIRALYEFLPATDVREKLHVAIRKALMKHLGQDIRYYLSAVEKKNFNEFTASLPECPILMILGLTPIEQKVIIHLDHHIANLVVNKLLGGGDVAQGEIKPLTETEQGVLQYLVMQVLSKIYALTGSEPRVHFRFERFVFDSQEVAKFARAREGVCILTLEISIFDQSGFARLVFPYPFLEEILSLSAGAGSSKKEREYFGRQLAKWGFIKTSLWAEAGNCLLSPVEMKDLEPGDVVLFDETELKLVGKVAKGEVLIHCGAAEGGVSASLTETDPKRIRCKLNNIVK